MSFLPLQGPATLHLADPPGESDVEFTGGPDDDGLTPRLVRMPIRGAIPVLCRALRRDDVHRSVGLLAGATLLALRLVAEGNVRRSASGTAWRMGALLPADDEAVRRLVLARHGDVPVDVAEALVRSVLDAVADAVTRRPPSASATSWGEPDPGEVAGPSEVRLSLRVEAPEEQLEVGALTLVVQAHDVDDPSHVVDAVDLGARGRLSLLAALRDAAQAWPVLAPLLRERTPDRLELATDEVTGLLQHGVPALRELGVDVFWPKALQAELTPRARVRTRHETPLQTGLFGPEAMFSFDWRLAVKRPEEGGFSDLTDDEMRALVAPATPIVRLRDSWVVVDPALARRARRRLTSSPSTDVTPAQAVRAALTGRIEVGGEELEVHPGATLLALQERVAGVLGTSPLSQPVGLVGTMRDYQRRGMTWLAELTGMGLGGCLADDMGLGKTVTVIALHLHRRERHLAAGATLVVCPTSLLGTWEAEIRRFAPGVEVRRFHGSRRDLSGACDGFVLTTYGTMRRDHERLAGHRWDLVVADEAQHVKNAASAAAKQLRTIPSTCRVALTGTPVENDLSELWAILDWTVPGLLGSRAAFRKVWAAPIEAGVDPEVTRRFARLVEPFLLRRRKSDPGIAPELPVKTETDEVVGMTREQVVLYQALVRDSMERIERSDPEARRGLVLAMLTGLKQICNHPAHYLHQAAGRLHGRSAKLDLLEELLSTILAEGGAVLVFTQYVAMARLLERRLADLGIDTLLLHGGLPAGERERMVAAFQAGGPPVFLLSLKAGGTGLNLTRADHVIHVDRWWNPAVEDQATDRAHRIGQTRPVQVHRLVTEGTIEQRIGDLLERKRGLAESVLGAGSPESAITELGDDELRDLVTLSV